MTTEPSTVYLDFNATTPVDQRVLEAMLPYFTARFGNAASAHAVGVAARRAVEEAREKVAAAIGAYAGQVVFTSGATESVNLAIKGTALAAHPKRSRIVTVATEHKAVLDASRALARFGIGVQVVGVDRDGLPDLDELADTIDDQTAVVSVMAANNETGVIAPISVIAELAHRRGALMHCDATQAVGKIGFDVQDAEVDLASFSAHKIYGPQGMGALYVRSGDSNSLVPLIDGGGHERGLRSGTLNTPGCVGFGEAARLASGEWEIEAERLRTLRDRLEATLTTTLEGVSVNGSKTPRLPGTTNVRIAGTDSDAMMLAMPDVAVSSGSACTAASPSPSHVLRAMGLSYEEAQECLRLSLGRGTTIEDIDYAISAIKGAANRVRELASLGV
jgi:cysteine desulfurase